VNSKVIVILLAAIGTIIIVAQLGYIFERDYNKKKVFALQNIWLLKTFQCLGGGGGGS